ncbi:MAG: glycosyltransferase [Calditrichaeota bacterium]|nr:MAG: glycosyltransferase [Calditrichota bacterium]
MKYKDKVPVPKSHFKELPKVTVQLPIFNEMYVASRLVDAITKLDYPKDLLEIQVLDDSTDETQNILSKLVQDYKKQGFDIQYLHRTDRTGFKAGALAEGLKVAKGNFVAIFDADFVPNPEMLKQSIHFFTDEKVGMIQTRWGHINRDYSLLTKIQAVMLDGHFVVEQTARNRSGSFFNFNGTAGIWRKKAILESGGWQHDTLTEDLDLSYRAQLDGWDFIFLPHIVTPAELPVDMNAFKSQQHRWAKGSIQTMKKLLPKILGSKLPFKVKFEAFFHLTNNIAYLLMSIPSFLVIPVIVSNKHLSDNLTLSTIGYFLFFFFATFSVSMYYLVSQKYAYNDWKDRIKLLPLLMGIGIGLSINNSKAVLEALFNHATDFIRTPKYGDISKSSKRISKKYITRKNFSLFLELGLAFYFTTSLFYLFWETKDYVSIPFLLLFQFGFLYVSMASFLPGILKRT